MTLAEELGEFYCEHCGIPLNSLDFDDPTLKCTVDSCPMEAFHIEHDTYLGMFWTWCNKHHDEHKNKDNCYHAYFIKNHASRKALQQYLKGR